MLLDPQSGLILNVKNMPIILFQNGINYYFSKMSLSFLEDKPSKKKKGRKITWNNLFYKK
jgi:hypothetical protein